MKIGILTYHRSHNYGALLQALALRYVLTTMGNEVYFIDYFPWYHKKMYKVFNREKFQFLSWKGKIKTLIRLFATIVPILQRKRQFLKFINSEISPFCKSLEESFDCIVYGSDQIWRKQPYLCRYNPIYFGVNDIKTKRHVSYAASLVELPQTTEDSKLFCDLVSNLDYVSVRENTTKKFLEKNGFKDVSLGIDPTLLLTKDQWEHIIPSKKLINGRYILMYDLLNDGGHETFDMKDVAQFASRNNCQIVRIHAKVSSLKCIQNRYADSPSDFINLIRHATCVLTSGYHGLIFALIMERPMYCCFPVDYDRPQSLLGDLGLSERLLTPENPKLPEHIMLINWHNINKRLAIMRKSSLQYLGLIGDE